MEEELSANVEELGMNGEEIVSFIFILFLLFLFHFNYIGLIGYWLKMGDFIKCNSLRFYSSLCPILLHIPWTCPLALICKMLSRVPH